MASMACQKLTPIYHQDHHRHHHHHHLFAMDPDTHNSISATDIRCIFLQGVVRVNKPATTTTTTTTTTTAAAMEEDIHKAASNSSLCESPNSMENSESSISSCFMSSNSDDEEEEEVSSSISSASSFLSPDATPSPQHEGPLNNLTSLCAALPIKRGLSRYFSGKSQSFSSLAHVSSVVDLAKPENPFVKRRRTAAGGSLVKNHSYPPRCASSAAISKRHVNNRYKNLRSLPLHEDTDLEGQTKPSPAVKCFSLPEFQETGF